MADGQAKTSIGAQIEEVEFELRNRARDYPRLIQQNRLRQGEADIHVDRMKAVLKTLEFVRDNAELIRAAVEVARK